MRHMYLDSSPFLVLAIPANEIRVNFKASKHCAHGQRLEGSLQISSKGRGSQSRTWTSSKKPEADPASMFRGNRNDMR